MTINQPSFSSAMIILAIIFILFLAGVGILNAPVEFVLIVVTLVTAFYARYYGARWRDIVNIFMSKIKEAVPAMLILLSIGMLIGCWIVSGTIPLMVLYGLEMVSPHYLYLTAFLVTVCISFYRNIMGYGGYYRRSIDGRGCGDGRFITDYRRGGDFGFLFW